MQQIPFLDLKAQYASLREEIAPAIQRVLDRCDFIGGRAIQEFENAFAEFCDSKYCVGVSNGSDAIYLALRALGVGPGDEVITVVNTFIGTTVPISRTGATIRFVDANPMTMNIDVAKIEAAITPKTKAIVPVHLYGQPADMEHILKLARQHNLYVCEDAAQAHGSTYRGKTAGSMGDIACFSFYPGKNLGAYGDAGAVVTNNEAYAEKVRLLRDCGRTSKYEHAEEGFNHRLDTMQAAILGVKLKYLSQWNDGRRRVAARYNEHFKGNDKIWTVAEPEGFRGVYHLFVIQVDDRDRVMRELQEAGIASGIHYPIPLHLQPAYAHMKLQPGTFPVAEAVAPRLVSLPIFAEMTDDMVDYVAEKLIKIVN